MRQDSRARWSTQHLKEIEARETDPRNDFGSYRMVNAADRLTDESLIRKHGFTDPAALRKFYRLVADELRDRGVQFDSFVDVGCGLGFVTGAFHSATGARGYGIEISHDAVEFASRHHPECRFIADGVDPGNPACPLLYLLGRLDSAVVIASELYPFTRTADPEMHRDWLNHVFSGATVSQLMIVVSAMYMRDLAGTQTFLSTVSQWKDWGFTADVCFFPAPRICRYIPRSFHRFLRRIYEAVAPTGKGSLLVTFVSRA